MLLRASCGWRRLQWNFARMINYGDGVPHAPEQKEEKNNTPAIYYNIIICCARIIIGWFINLSLDTSSLRNDFNNSMCFIRSSYIVNKEAASLAPTSFFYFFIFYDWWFEQHIISRRCMQKTYTCRWI